jgi:hypothetical protein
MFDKFSPKLDKCIFMGYSKKTKWCHFYYKSKNKIIIVKYAYLEKKILTRENSESNARLKKI